MPLYSDKIGLFVPCVRRRYEFDVYREKSLAFYTLLMSFADEVQAVSIDEALVDVTKRVAGLRQIPPVLKTLQREYTDNDVSKALADEIRYKIHQATDCQVSIGISHNILLSRLATRHAKPAGSFHLTADKVEAFMAKLDVSQLHNFGYATQKKIESVFKTTNCGELLKQTKGALQGCLGEKNGLTLWRFLRGIDPRPLTPQQERRSVSAEVNVSPLHTWWSKNATTHYNQLFFAVWYSIHLRTRGHQISGRSLK